MKRLVLFLVIGCLALFLVGSCGKKEEPAKAQKPAAKQAAPAKEVEKKQPEKKEPAAQKELKRRSRPLRPSPLRLNRAKPSPPRKRNRAIVLVLNFLF
jgi:type IV secretory pathway VirB10-like protein